MEGQGTGFSHCPAVVVAVAAGGQIFRGTVEVNPIAVEQNTGSVWRPQEGDYYGWP